MVAFERVFRKLFDKEKELYKVVVKRELTVGLESKETFIVNS